MEFQRTETPEKLDILLLVKILKKSIAGNATNEIAKLVNALTQSEHDSSYLPNQLKGKKKKKKRKGSSDNQ